MLRRVKTAPAQFESPDCQRIYSFECRAVGNQTASASYLTKHGRWQRHPWHVDVAVNAFGELERLWRRNAHIAIKLQFDVVRTALNVHVLGGRTKGTWANMSKIVRGQ